MKGRGRIEGTINPGDASRISWQPAPIAKLQGVGSRRPEQFSSERCLRLCDVPDPIAAAVAGSIACLVEMPVVQRLALVGPLLAAIVTGNYLECAHVVVAGFGLQHRPVDRTHSVTCGLVGLLVIVEDI